MQTRIHLTRFHQSTPQLSKPFLLFHFPLLSRENSNLFSFSNTKWISTRTPLTFCSLTSSESLKYGGWDDVELGGGSVQSSESNLLRKIFISLGINDKRYIFVYLLGFVCALAISRVRVSSIVVVPAIVLVFTFGFSFGVVNGGQINELGSTGIKKKSKDDSSRVLIESLKYLVDLFDEFDGKIENFKTDIKRGISSNLITVGDLEGYIKVIESIALSALNTRNVAEYVLDNLSIENQEIERNSYQKVSKKKKEKIGTGFDFSQFVFGLFKGNPKTNKTKEIVKRETTDFAANVRTRGNFLAPAVEKGIPLFINAANDSIGNEDSFSSINDFSDPYLVQIGDEEFVERTRRTNTLDDNDNMSFMRFDIDSKSVTEDKEYSFENTDLHSLNRSRLNPDESFEYLDDLLDLNDKSLDQDQKLKKINGNHVPVSNTEHKMSTKNRTVEFDSAPSSMVSDDIVFNGYLTEANTLLKKARQYLNNKGKKRDAEKTLIRSTKLLSNAIDMKPMSLIAVGQLGNTYLLHGELKLKMSRRLRFLLTRRNESLHDDIGYLIDGLGKVGSKEKIGSVLVDVCEECEELLVNAGRKYKLAMSIDSNDVRALYNWGLALSFRAQLVADIGPEAASDADKLYMAAIDKFDAMMSKSNVYASDALFRWGLALHQRSRLRRRNIREKVKLLKQAKRLYEDAIDMDTHNNLQVKQALTSCISELNYMINY